MIDLRSDTVTRPSPGMRAAIAAADVGDDGHGEDPEVNALEAEVAELFGFPAAMFVPSGTMGNQLGLRLLVGPGQELLCDSLAHVVRIELGAPATLSGITTRTWYHPHGRVDLEQIRRLAVPTLGKYVVRTAAIAVENTHNFGGGTVQRPEDLVLLREFAAEIGCALHLDGARIWNAHAATGIPLADLAAGFDTVSVCLSKGLGAPVGSVLLSSADRIEDARVWRKRYGGAMRQAGVLAAAGRYALRENIARIAEDHARARRLAEALGADPAGVESNITVVTVSNSAAARDRARESGVAISVLSPAQIRMVTHLDIDDAALDKAVAVLAPLIAEYR
jgi:threonine aldolase